MNTVHPASNSENTQQQILDAAEARFRTYGYGKTTMVEIAGDVRMSAANLYRYFDNKQDIAAACAGRCMGRRLDLLRTSVDKDKGTAAQRLENFVLAMLRYTHEETAQHKKIAELVDFIASERQELVHRKSEAEQAIIANILEQGNNNGEFDVKNITTTAASLLSALTLFHVPIFMTLYPLDAFEIMAKDVVTLLVKGLARR